MRRLKLSLRAVFFLWIGASGVLTAHGDSRPSIPHEVLESEKLILYFPLPRLQLHRQLVEADVDHWEMLGVRLDYEGVSNEEQAQLFKSLYPGFELRRVLARSAGDLTLRILGQQIKLENRFNARLSTEGPYVDSWFMLDQNQSRSLGEIGAEQVEAKLETDVAFEKIEVLERVSLDSKICQQVSPVRGNLWGVIGNLARVFNAIDQMTFNYPSTRESLQVALVKSCVELEKPNPKVNSFAELLQVMLRPSPKSKRIDGMTSRKQMEIRRFELKPWKIEVVEGAL